MTTYKAEYEKWLNSPSLSEDEWKELDAIRGDEKEIESRFFAPLEFGTAGLRGTMKLGLHHMNVHVIRHATQAFANVVAREGEEAKRKGVVIARDCRLNGDAYAREAACIMAANGIHVRIFDDLRPTPELSFAVRYYQTTAGINITASHNPKEYNGYKVYWSDGAQLPPHHAAAIAAEMERIDIFTGFETMDFEEGKKAGLIEIIGEETDEAYLNKVLGEAIDHDVVARNADKLEIVYTPFHGAGHRLVPEALKRLGIKHLTPEPQQMVIDGNFPTVVSPNPENPEGFYLAVDLAKKVGSNLIIGTDPDSDRVGVMVRDTNGEFVTITGNQMGVLLLDYVIGARNRTGTMPANPAALKTIVTTEMAREICRRNGIYMEDTFTGFKFMAEKIAQFEAEGSHNYIFAYEESYGYMMGDYVRDKDAVTASMMIAEMAAYYCDRGMTLLDALKELYAKYGNFAEKTLNLVMPGLDGLNKMKHVMGVLRENPPESVAGISVSRVRDYQSGQVSVPKLGAVEQTHIKGSNVLYFELSDGSSFIIRPSGTEPKIKVYLLVKDESQEKCHEKIARYAEYAETLKEL